VQGLIAVNILNRGTADQRTGDGFTAVNMDVSMQKVSWLKHFDQPAKGYNPSVRQVLFIVHLPWWRVSHENIQVATQRKFIPEEPWYQTQHHLPVLPLSILVWTLVVL
jgi:hypothetical protein